MIGRVEVGASGGPLPAALERVAAGLAPVRSALEAEGMPSPEWSGKLIRPLVGYAAAGEEERAGDALWFALAAVQLAHEASLLHDDVIDGAVRRRNEPTVAVSRGVAAALVEGDHLLTSAYRLALRAGSPAWSELFARAVERTVAGEKAQARSAGTVLGWVSYESIVLGKSGELLGAALAAGPTLRGAADAGRHYELGRRVGLVYQMLDDLLDYCPHANTGKAALGDYERGLWTWPRIYVELPDGLPAEEVVQRLRSPGPSGVSPLDRCLTRLRWEAAAVSGLAAELIPGDSCIPALLASWVEQAAAAVDEARAAVTLPPVDGWERLMEEHARSFRFAARLFPADRREQVVGVYAWCRYTDDLVDGVDLPPAELEARLDAWLRLSRRAYDGEATGNVLADRVMAEMRAAGVPFTYASELVEGMRMDIRGTEYRTVAELWRYTYRVASVVGLWMTELFGIRDPWMLDRAAALGHAMQLTNILRDVGEDLDAGRLYLPTSWLTAHGLTRQDLERMRRTGEVDARYRELIERLLAVAEAEYDHAFPAIRRLPDFFRRPVAVAAEVYRGIHDGIRSNQYDNLSRRAYTSFGRKLWLAVRALWRAAPSAPSVGAAPGAAVARAAVLLLAALPAAGAVEAQTTGFAAPATVDARVERLGGGDAGEPALRAVALLWQMAVEDPAAVDAGLDAVRELGTATPPPDADGLRLLRAYEGAFLALRARHGSWPPHRLRDVRAGFRLLDAVVAEAPEAVTPRWIRLMSGFHLPGVFGRSDEVDDDLAALARLLPATPAASPLPASRADVAGFLLAHAELEPARRAELEALRAAAPDGPGEGRSR